MINKIYVTFKKIIKDNYKFIITLLAIAFICCFEFPFIIYKSGGTIDLNNRIEIDTKYKQEGKIEMSYVTAIKGTLPFMTLSLFIPDWDIIPLKDVAEDGNYEQTIEIGKEFLNEGIDNAIFAAFNEAKMGVKITQTINKVVYLSKESKTNLKIGDEIISLNDHKISSLEEIKKLINSLKENDEVKILVKNNNKEYLRTARIYKDKIENDLKVGISIKTNYKYITEIPVTIKMKENESGSSGGLMMGLAIYNAITREDITKGLHLVGTGSIDRDGKIEEIGGVKYKLLAAAKHKADVFFCPVENYQEAMKVKKRRNLKIKIVKVSNLKDAINYLESI